MHRACTGEDARLVCLGPGGVPLATCALPVGMFYFTLLYATAPPSVRLLRVDISVKRQLQRNLRA